MKSTEKLKTQKLVDKIQYGDFDENDVDNLFMKLRSYADGYPIFREIADFVAHNDERDKGMINELLKTMYLKFKYINKYNKSTVKLQLSKPIPKWVKELLILQIKTSDPIMLRRDFKVTPERLIAKVKKAFKDNKHNSSTQLLRGKLSSDSLKAIKHFFAVLVFKELWNQDEMIELVIEVIKMNDLDIDLKKFREKSDCFTLNTMLLIHDTHYKLFSKKTAYTYIASYDPEKYNTDKSDGYTARENLIIHSSVPVDIDGKEVDFKFGIMTTNLSVNDYCDHSLIENNILVFTKELMISDECKLVKI